MKAQSVVISAYMAVALLIVAMTTIYVWVLPHSQTFLSSRSTFDVRSIVYSRFSWSARTLAQEIYNKLGARYVSVNITVFNITSGKILYSDYYIIEPITASKGLVFISYNLTNFSPNGIMYIYNIKVGR